MLHNVLDPTSNVANMAHLMHFVAKSHALFVNTFVVDSNHSFFMNSTAHAVLNLPDLLEQFGSLTGVSKFLIERLVEKTTSMIKSRSKPEANLYHKTHKLFCLQLMEKGTHRSNQQSWNILRCRRETLRGADKQNTTIDGDGKKLYVTGKKSFRTSRAETLRINLALSYLNNLWNDCQKHITFSNIVSIQSVTMDLNEDLLTLERVAAFKDRQITQAS